MNVEEQASADEKAERTRYEDMLETVVRSGGSAFPVTGRIDHGSGQMYVRSEGMSLRDWLAGQIAPALVGQWSESAALEAYKRADDMLKVRLRLPPVTDEALAATKELVETEVPSPFIDSGVEF